MKSDVTVKNSLNVVPLENSVSPLCVNTKKNISTETPNFSRMSMSAKSNQMKSESAEMDKEERPDSPY